MNKSELRSSYFKVYSNHEKDSISCPKCLQRMTLKEYRRSHAQVYHGISPTKTCVYCCGSYAFKQSIDYEHLKRCLEKFIFQRDKSTDTSNADSMDDWYDGESDECRKCSRIDCNSDCECDCRCDCECTHFCNNVKECVCSYSCSCFCKCRCDPVLCCSPEN